MFYGKVTPVETRVYTTQFRIIGRMHVPTDRGTAEYLNADDRPHLAMTRCAMYASGIAHPPRPEDFRYETDFAAVPKDQIAWVVGGAAQPPDPSLPQEKRPVYLVYPNYVLAGRLALRPNQRTSDFLSDVASRRPFQTLYDARVMRPADAASLAYLPVMERLEAAVVNLLSAGGVFDLHADGRAPSYVLEEGE